MKLLYVTPGFPYPPRRGYLLMAYHQIEHLAARHSVDLISFVDAEADRSNADELANWCGRIDTVELPAWRCFLNMGLGMASALPFQISYFKSAKMAATVHERLRKKAYDIVVFQLTRMAQYRPVWYEGPTILSMVDPFVLNYQRSLSWRPWYARPWLQAEIARLKNYESQQALRFDRVLLISEADVRDYQNFMGAGNVDWVPHAIDVNYFSPLPSVARRTGMIVITGNMFYAPNVDAVNYFCREIFPLIRKHVPEASLWLVGSRPAEAVRKWGKDERIKVTGFVSDVRPYLNQAMVSVCPVRLNVGTQTKVLEALAMGTPVVSTSAGNHGIGAVSGEHLYVVDTPSEFAERVVALLKGKEWDELSRRGRRFVVEHFTWEKSVARLEQILAEITEQAITRRGRSCDP